MTLKLSEEDVFHTYMTAYDTEIEWEQFMDPEIFQWMDIYQKAKNCSLSLTVPALLSMTACFCGPKTRVIGQSNGFSTSINAYLLAVCDPGGGKTVAYENVIEPVIERLLEKTGKKFSLDNYTQAGMHKNQVWSYNIRRRTSFPFKY